MIDSINRLSLQTRTARLALVFAALAAATAVFAQGTDAETEPATEQQEPATTPTVAALFIEREDLQEFLVPLQDTRSSEYLAARRTELQGLRDKLSNMQKVVSDGTLTSLSYEDLVDLQTDVRTELRSLELVAGQVRARAEERDKQLDELDDKRESWAQLTDVAAQRDAPASVLAVAAETAANLDETRAALLADRNAALEDLSAVAGLQQAAARFNGELKGRRDELELVSQSAADAPLWSKSGWTAPSGFDEAARALSRYWTTIVSHIAANYVILGAIFVGLWIAARLLLMRTGQRVADAMQTDTNSMRAATVFNKPRSAAFLTALLGVAWFGPPAPAAFNYLLWAVMPLPAAWLAVSIFAKPIRLSIYTIALVVALMALKPFVDAMPLVGRFVLLLQSVLVIAALLIDYKRGNWQAAFPSVNPSVIRWSVRAVSAVLLVVIVLEVTGLVGIANVLRSLVIGGLGFAMIFTSITYVLTGIVIALVYIKPFSALPFVKNQRWTVIRTARKSIRYFMALLWILVTMNFAGQLVPAVTWLAKYLGTDFKVGAVTLHVSSLVAGLLILYATLLLKRLVSFLFASESLSGVNVTEGVAFAVSKVLGYVIIVAGFLFAISAMGFDITKVTVLAGAVGVGIGLGLQSIVNNFLSGLILLFEQPIKINDIAKVDDLMGTVRELGVRATVIETFDGAEVIVPNSDFISKTVTNWTKSNRRRRAEIEVGVAYGTDPQMVLDILNRSAQAHEEVMKDPEPFAVFVGFGDSSLNFRLYVWLTDLSEVIRTPGHIRQQILNELNAAGIEIPFPQRDVRVTMSPASAAGGDAPETGGVVDMPAPAQ